MKGVDFMSYRLSCDIAVAECVFEAWGKTREELFMTCAQAVLNVMLKNPDSVENKHQRAIEIEEEDLEDLLVQFLEEIIYLKDFYQLLLKPKTIQIEWEGEEEKFFLLAHMEGETMAAQKHFLGTDVKPVISQRPTIIQTPQGWNATVALDV